jgi:catechol 2,3-dioxygenase
MPHKDRKLWVMFELAAIDHVALAVQDMERSARWYKDVLGFERLHAEMWDGVPAFIGTKDFALALFPAPRNAAPVRKVRDHLGMLHLAFRAGRRDFLAAQEHLIAHGIAFEFQDHEISHSIYFEDPDGVELEITTYELS